MVLVKGFFLNLQHTVERWTYLLAELEKFAINVRESVTIRAAGIYVNLFALNCISCKLLLLPVGTYRRH